VIADYDPASNHFILHTSLTEKDLARQVPGASWQERMPNTYTGQPGTWVVTASWPAYCAINGIFKHTLTPSESYREWAETSWKTLYEPLTLTRFSTDANIGPGPIAARLWPLQRVAVQTMVWAEKYLVLDDMGGGKTATTLAALKLAAAVHGEAAVFPAIIVCPNKVRRSWKKIAHEDLGDGKGPLWPELRLEAMPKGKAAQRKVLERFLRKEHDPEGGNCAPEICGGTRYDPCGRAWPEGDPDTWPQVLVINWEALRLLSRVEKFGQIELAEKDRTPGPLNEIPWRTFAADEVHRAKNRTALQTRALKAIANGTPSVGTGPCRFRWGLTGTLVSEDAAEAWSIWNLIDPGAHPAYTRFVDRYATQLYNGWGGMEIGGLKPETAEEYHAAHLPFSIRRLREQFDPFKPRRVHQTLTVPMETKQAKAYHELRKNMAAALDGGTLTATENMHKSNRLFQLAQAWGEMVDKGRRDPISGEPILDLLLKAPSNKVSAMLEIIEDFGISSRPGPGNGRAIVFGAQSRQLIGLCEDALNKAKIPYSLIAGGMSDSAQDLQERRFETGQTRVCLCVVSAAKEGLNSLVRADTLVFLQKSDSNNDNEQFRGRIDRPGQTAKSVTFIDVVSEGTLEEFVQKERLEEKAATLQQFLQDARVLQEMLRFPGTSG
jgi:SNF2 family DNA or RNA helicase